MEEIQKILGSYTGVAEDSFVLGVMLSCWANLSFNNLLQKAVCKQNVTNPVSLPFNYFM
jgi:hypothetical protein